MTTRALVIKVLIGGCLGLVASLLAPVSYEASTTICFPGVNAEMMSRLNQALRVSPDSQFEPSSAVSAAPNLSGLARTLLKSKAAAQYALQQAGESSLPRRWSDPLEEFARRLEVNDDAPGTLTLRLLSRTSDSARIKAQSLLDYYSQYTSKNPLTRVRQTRLAVEERLVKSAKSLRSLEEKMSRSSSRELRSLGDAALKANPKVMTQLWLRRLEDDQQSREILNRMQKIRASGAKSTQEEAWLSSWSKDQKSALKPSAGFANITVRRQDILERASLEREYYEALLRYRAYVLQHSFLLTLDQLESTSYTTLDPLQVRSVRTRSWLWSLAGAGLGLLIALSSLKARRGL